MRSNGQFHRGASAVGKRATRLGRRSRQVVVTMVCVETSLIFSQDRSVVIVSTDSGWPSLACSVKSVMVKKPVAGESISSLNTLSVAALSPLRSCPFASLKSVMRSEQLPVDVPIQPCRGGNHAARTIGELVDVVDMDIACVRMARRNL